MRPKYLVIAIIVLALFLRLWGMCFGLPYLYHPDEPRYITRSIQIFNTGDFNLDYFLKPSLLIYLNALAYTVYFFIKSCIFMIPSSVPNATILTMGIGKISVIDVFILGRALSVFFGTLVVLLAFFIGKTLTRDKRIGLLSALFMALSPTAVVHSHFITTDTLLVLFLMLSFLMAIKIYREGKSLHYIMAAVFVGLATATKYNGIFTVFFIIVAHFFRYGRKGFRDYKLYFSFLLSIIAFFAVTPFALINYKKFFYDLSAGSKHYSGGHEGMEGHSFNWYLTYLWRVEGPIVLLALFGFIKGVYRRSKEIVILASFPIIYFILISFLPVRNDRTLLPVLPFLFLMGSSFIVHSFCGKEKKKSMLKPMVLVAFLGVLLLVQTLGLFNTVYFTRYIDSVANSAINFIPLSLYVVILLFFSIAKLRKNKLKNILVAILMLITLAVPLVKSVQADIQFVKIDGREVSRKWISKSLPVGSKVAVESYAPYVDYADFNILALQKLCDYAPQWYKENHVDYLVFSEGMFGRFYKDPVRHSKYISGYKDLFDVFTLIKRFDEGDYTILVYKVD